MSATLNPNIPTGPGLSLDTTVTAYKIPLSAIALWPGPNYVDPERRFGLAPFAFFLEILTTIILIGRIWARMTRRAGNLGADDVIITVAWLFGTAFTALTVSGVVDSGFDRHVWDVPQSMVVKGGFVAWGSEILFLTTTCLTKISILLFYRRLVDRSYSKKMQNLIYAAIAFTIVYYIVFVFFLIFVCDPVSASWRSLDIGFSTPYKCSSRRIMDPLAGAISVFSDFYALMIPEIVVYNLQLARRKKIALFVLFGSGAIVAGAGIARTVWLSRLHTDRLRDLTWVAYEILVWTAIEMHGAIICASAPAIKALVTVYFSETKGDTLMGSLAGQQGTITSTQKGRKGTLTSTMNTESQDWPLTSEKPDSRRYEEKPPTPPKNDVKTWYDGQYGGITVTERYSVVSLPNTFANAKEDGGKKGKRVLGF